MTMDIEGSVQVMVDWDGHRIRAVDIRSTRSDFVQALLAGRRANDAEALLPRVFSICARAQAAAVAVALDAARETAEHDARHGEMAVLAEAALEYLWRLQIDLPGLLGLPQRPEALARLRRALGRGDGTTQHWRSFIDALRTAVQEESAGAGERFNPTDPAAFADWETRSEASAAHLLRALRAVPLAGGRTALLPGMTELLLREIGDALAGEPGFSRRPAYAGAPAECGARARMARHPLLHAVETRTSRTYQRILARWLELAGIPERLTRLLDGEALQPWVQGVTLAPGCGIAGVETARGLLVHAVTLTGDRVTGYRIVAPTEWNFHPAGALGADLAGVPAETSPEVEQRAALAVQSLDPCVRYTLEIARRNDA
jgi:uptake hydrogenase large subunit